MNPFVLADKDPFSTFAADVDTASYDIFRRGARGGSLPDPNSVRLEEYANYFSYNYPAPALNAADPFSISLAAADHVAQGRHEAPARRHSRRRADRAQACEPRYPRAQGLHEQHEALPQAFDLRGVLGVHDRA
jgi:hypothetical protein